MKTSINNDQNEGIHSKWEEIVYDMLAICFVALLIFRSITQITVFVASPPLLNI